MKTMFNPRKYAVQRRLFFTGLYLALTVALHGGQYRLIGWPAAIDRLYCQADSEMVPASIAFGKPSKYYTLASGKDLTLYRKNESTEPGAPPYLPVANLAASGLKSDSNLVVVTPKGENAYYLKAINDSREDYPVGSMVLCSFVPYKIGIKIEDEMFLLSPGEVAVPKLQNQGAHTNIQVAGFRDSDNRVKFSTNMLLRPRYRYFMIIQDTTATPVPSMPDDNGLSMFVIPEYIFKPVAARTQ